MKEKEEFKDFHKRVSKEGEVLEDKYQPQLKKGINLDVKFKSVKEDEKDGDMDVKITIKPNDADESFAIEAGDGEVAASVLDTKNINSYSGENKVKITEKRENNQIVGYKAATKKGSDTPDGITVGDPGGNKYTKKVKENKSFEEEFGKLWGLSPDNRRKKINSSSTHNKFEPKEINRKPLPEGGEEITYHYEEGKQQFKVIVGKDGFPTSVQGDNLTLHDLGRGTTEDPTGKKTNSGHDSAHLIANMFGGSGYKKAENIIATSSVYNQTVMVKTEKIIADWIRSIEKAHHFSMKVDVSYMKPNEKVELKKIKEAILKYTKDDDERRTILKDSSKLEKRINTKLKESGQPRVKRVDYKVEIYSENNEPIDLNNFIIEEADLLFGTKK
jgi:hypothetical protein